MVEHNPFDAESFIDSLEIEKLKEKFAGFVPTEEDYCDLRDEVTELVRDYLTKAHLYGDNETYIRYLDLRLAMFSFPSEPERRVGLMQKAVDTARDLLGVRDDIDTLFLGTEDRSGAECLGRAWPGLRFALDKHRHMVMGRETFRKLVQDWGVRLTEEEGERLNRGRPRGSYDYPTPDSIISWLGPRVRECLADGSYPSKTRIASMALVSPDSMWYHVKRHFSTWEAFINAAK